MLARGQPWRAFEEINDFAREKLWEGNLWVATYCFFHANNAPLSYPNPKIWKRNFLILFNVQKLHGLINRATPGIIHLIIMEWIVTLHQILSRIICRNNGLISNQGKGQSGYTPSHIRSRRSPVALMLADSIRHWYEKKENKRKKKKRKKRKNIKKNRRIVFRLSSGLLLTRTRGLKWKIGTKGMVDRARGRVSKIRESLEFVCRTGDSMHAW